jgi:hypothetical protein
MVPGATYKVKFEIDLSFKIIFYIKMATVIKRASVKMIFFFY